MCVDVFHNDSSVQHKFADRVTPRFDKDRFDYK